MSQRLADSTLAEGLLTQAQEIILEYNKARTPVRLVLGYVVCLLFPPALLFPIRAHKRLRATRRGHIVRRLADVARPLVEQEGFPLGNVYFMLRGIWPLNNWPMPIQVACLIRPGVTEEDLVEDSLP